MQLQKFTTPYDSSLDSINDVSSSSSSSEEETDKEEEDDETDEEEETEETEEEKKVFSITEEYMIDLLDLMADLQLAEEQLNELRQMDISQWMEHLSWLSAVFSLRRLHVTWEEDERLIEAALYLKELDRSRVKSFLEVCEKQPPGTQTSSVSSPHSTNYVFKGMGCG